MVSDFSVTPVATLGVTSLVSRVSMQAPFLDSRLNVILKNPLRGSLFPALWHGGLPQREVLGPIQNMLSAGSC